MLESKRNYAHEDAPLLPMEELLARAVCFGVHGVGMVVVAYQLPRNLVQRRRSKMADEFRMGSGQC